MRALVLPLVLVLLAPGCLLAGSNEVAGPAALDTERSLATIRDLVADLPCDARVPAAGESANVRHLGGAPLDMHGYVGVGELWMQGDFAFVARHGTGGFSIVDVTDPLALREVGVWDPETTRRGLDVKATPDGTGVLMAHDEGVALVDVRVPEDPVLETYLHFSASQAHMVTVFTVDGQDHIAVPKGDGEDMPIWRIVGEPGARTFEKVSSPKLAVASGLTGLFSPEDLTRPHDAFFQEDPIDGTPTLWVANTWEGIVALDVSDPAMPKEILRIPNLNVQYTHTVQTALVDERRITVSVSEVGVNTMKVYDTTDLSAPRLLAEWHVGNPALPQHNIQIVGEHLYLAHYDQGTIVFEMAALAQGLAEPVARFGVIDEEGRHVRPGVPASMLFGGVWDVSLKDGLIYTTDAGLQVFAFGCLAPGDRLATSTG